MFDKLNSEEVTEYGETSRRYKKDAPLKYKFTDKIEQYTICDGYLIYATKDHFKRVNLAAI